MKRQDYEQLTLFPVDSPVNHSAKPESNEEKEMTVTSGLRCLESYEKSGPLGSLVRMCLASYIWHSTRCNLIWKKKVTKSNLCLFQLAVLTPRTKENDASFWPTPSTGAALCAGTGSFNTLKRMAEKGLITEEERKQLSQGNGGKTNPALLEWLMGYEEQFTKLIPTPTATDYKGGITTRYWTPPRSQFVHVEREDRSRVRWSAEKFGGGHSPWENWPDEPDIYRVVDGVPNRVDRIRCLGNAVVPEMFYPIFYWIKEIEDGIDNKASG